MHETFQRVIPVARYLTRLMLGPVIVLDYLGISVLIESSRVIVFMSVWEVGNNPPVIRVSWQL